MKKICMIVPSFSAKGGIATVVSGYRNSELEKHYHIHYIETYCDGSKAKKLLKAAHSYIRFIKELAVFRPNLIHIHSSFGASFYRKLPFIFLSALLHIPVVNHIHGSELDKFFWKASNIEKKIKRLAFEKCSRVIVLSEEWKEQLGRIVDTNRIEVVKNYCPYQDRDTLDRKPNSKNVLFMGFISELKGCFDIPEVAKLVNDKEIDVRFLLAGTGQDSDIQRLLTKIHKDDIHNIELLGWMSGEKKERLLESAAVFFLPSYTEAMPMSILEAMGYGLPIVSSNIGGIPQLVKKGENGNLCDPGDVEGFADAIIQILQDSELRERMGNASKRIVQTEYSLEKHFDELIRIYNSVL